MCVCVYVTSPKYVTLLNSAVATGVVGPVSTGPLSGVAFFPGFTCTLILRPSRKCKID